MRIIILFLFLIPCIAATQTRPQPEVYIDHDGLMRWHKDGKECAFLGVNYTVPFAYGYRSVLRTGITPEKVIDEDVYHFARMGINAFRVHVWDTEISDSAGNLLSNEHLRLYDYLLLKLEQRGIRIMLTPLAFWGNGYPEPDSNTGSFSSRYNKQRVLVEEPAILAQENYLRQLMGHVNPYTKKKYMDDAFVIGMEINNEPHHSGSLKQASGYISKMVAAVRGSGWTKPVFYNISESPAYAKAVAESDIQGVSFQWYPTGLVANHTQLGNFLPNVDEYAIPFDTIAAFKGKSRMVYEFDAADILAPVMYPAMARSFRSAGFQWATQFAYDPMATANGNTEYQTHYLNLAYTPQKAISLMIAARVFQDIPLNRSYGKYPADTIFGYASIHPVAGESEWNAPDAFYYTSSTSTKPVSMTSLRHIAGTGNSAIIQYKGNGAYFLDRISQGVWRLECMPDIIELSDPFSRAKQGRIVRKIAWNEAEMIVGLPGLGNNFQVKGINRGNHLQLTATGNKFLLKPGTYLLMAKGMAMVKGNTSLGFIGLDEFVAPAPSQSSDDHDLKNNPGTWINAARTLNPKAGADLFIPRRDHEYLMYYNPDWKKYRVSYSPNQDGDTLMQIHITDSLKTRFFGWQFYIGDLAGRIPEKKIDSLVMDISVTIPTEIRIGLVDIYGTSFYIKKRMESSGSLSISLQSLTAGPSLLLPRPYPGFLPLWFNNGFQHNLELSQADKLECLIYSSGEENTITIKRVTLK